MRFDGSIGGGRGCGGLCRAFEEIDAFGCKLKLLAQLLCLGLAFGLCRGYGREMRIQFANLCLEIADRVQKLRDRFRGNLRVGGVCR